MNGLMISVNVDQGRVKSHRPFIKRDQNTHRKGRYFIDGNGDRFPVVFEQGLACSEIKAIQVIARSDAGFDFNRCVFTILQHLDKSDEEIVDSISKLLNISMLVGGAFISVDRDSLFKNN